MLQFRVDDFPNTKDAERDRHSPTAFREFHRALRDGLGGRRYLLGVIPGRCTDEDWSLLRSIREEVVVGMHGITHSEEALDRNGGNEFPHWYTRRTVETMLGGCLERFYANGIDRVPVYMPPRNVIDQRTLSVLPDLCFLAYTGGPETGPEMMRARHLRYLHSQPPFEYGRTDEMAKRGAIEYLNLTRPEYHTVTLHWTWETNIGLEHLRRFLGRLDRDLFQDFQV